jgi:dephospho-CoA kinase
LNVLGLVTLRRAQVHQQSAPDRADDIAVDGYTRFVDPLYDGAHAELRSTDGIVLPERGDVQYSRAMKPVVGLTGGIACGKTTVAQMFGEFGIPVIDADDLAREVVEPGTQGLQAIVDEFGRGVLDERGHLDRKRVGELVFGDEEARETLNAIMHPLIGAAGAKHIQAYDDHPAPYLLYEGALLVETGAHKAFSALVVVSADESLQRLRLIARDGFTVAETNARIGSQLPLDRKIAAADYVVTNNGDLDATRRQVAEIHDKLAAELASKEWT